MSVTGELRRARAGPGKTWALPVAVGLTACAASSGPRLVEPVPVPNVTVAAVADRPPAGPRAIIDFGAIDAWIECRRSGNTDEACEQRSAHTRWGAFAERARSSFGPPREDPPESPSLGAVESLVAAMKGWPDPSAEVAEYFPESMDVDVMVAVVGNGHGWGDMYTRPAPVDPSPADEASRLRGANAAVINAVLVAAQYGGLPAQQAASALGVLEHEMFHVLLHTYAQREATWQRWPEQPSAVQQLQWTVLDEGIAHFVDARAELIADGFPGERAETALQRLAEAATALERPDLEDAEREDLLRSAHQGRYWDKFASIAGMLMAYGVYREVGMEGIHRAVRCGPGALAASYASAAAQTSDLPALPEPLVPWTASDLCF